MATSAEIRRRLGHPVIDIDGHMAEHLPTLAPFFEREGLSLDHPSLRRLLPAYGGTESTWHEQTPGRAGPTRTPRGPWWSAPAARPSTWPRPCSRSCSTIGSTNSASTSASSTRVSGWSFSTPPTNGTARSRCRALNRANAETFAALSDRLTPVAAIPMHTPEEAVAELEYAVTTLGFKAVLCAGYVQRPFAALADDDPEVTKYAFWLDQFGIDSPYDYDPVWAKAPGARRLGRLSLRLHRDDAVPLDLELRVQPPVDARPRASSRWPSRSSSAG